MKKNYIAPSVIAYEVKACNLLAGSPGLQGGSAGTGTPAAPINFSRGDDDDNEW